MSDVGDEALVPAVWWWLSFADPGLPRGKQHLGVSIVSGKDLAAAMAHAWRLGCNPGGEVRGYQIEGPPPEGLRNRMLTAEQMQTYGESITCAPVR